MARTLLVAPLFLLAACSSQQSANHTDAHHPANPNATTVAPARTNAEDASAAQSPPSHDQAAPATLYACPMHPSVTSHNPEDRCPECGMKINKPLTQEKP